MLKLVYGRANHYTAEIHNINNCTVRQLYAVG